MAIFRYFETAVQLITKPAVFRTRIYEMNNLVMGSEVVLCVNHFAYRRSFINFDEMGR